MQEKLLEICENKLYQTKDEKQKTKLKLIEEILKTPNCFVHISFDTALNVLIELGFSKNDAQKAYKKLASFSSFKEVQND